MVEYTVNHVFKFVYEFKIYATLNLTMCGVKLIGKYLVIKANIRL